jgi:4-hydroxy-4-methyl-2-oxoglutarate aldolase
MDDNSTRPTSGIEAYHGLRVTDVVDGLDAMGMQDVGLMNRDIGPLWRDTDQFKHRFYGIAHTIRFVPTQRKVPDQSPDEFFTWMRNWYRDLASGPKTDGIKKGEVIVMDGFELGQTGFIGSNNALAWIAAGAVGVVTNGGARDTDELIKQGVPVYCRYTARGIRPGRVEFDAEQVPVNIGGATVRPGDTIVADGDGVVVIPAEIADDVAKYAWRHADHDKAGRRKIYEQLGMAPDWTLE